MFIGPLGVLVCRPGETPRAGSSVSPDVRLFSLADRANDAALLSALAVGDDAAAVAFVRRFQGPVFGLAVSITRDRALAEDIAQEAFLRAWRAAPNFDPSRGSALTWLLTITQPRDRRDPGPAIDPGAGGRTGPARRDHSARTPGRDRGGSRRWQRRPLAELPLERPSSGAGRGRRAHVSGVAGHGHPLGTAKTGSAPACAGCGELEAERD